MPSTLSTIFGLGRQASKGTGVTAMQGIRLTRLTNRANITVDDATDEFSAGAGPIPGDGGVRLGIYTPFSGAGRIRLDNFPTLLGAAGFDNLSSGGVGPYTHTILGRTNETDFKWYTALIKQGPTSDTLERVIRDCRLSRLRITAEANSVGRFEFEGMGIHEENAAGTETVTSESGPLLNTVAGAFTFETEGGAAVITALPRSISVEIANSFTPSNDDFIIGDTEVQNMEFIGQVITGTVVASLTEDTYQRLVYAGADTAAAGYDINPVHGNLNFRLESAEYAGATTPWSLTVDLPNLNAFPGEMAASGRSEIRIPITFQAYYDGTDQMATFTVVNDTASYT